MKGILLDTETGDLLIEKGVLAIGETMAQVAECLLNANRGEFKEFPLLGGEVLKMKNGEPDPMWSGNVKKMLIACGLPTKSVKIKDETIIIE